MAAVWRDNIRLITNGDSVDESTINRPLIHLTERTQYLKARLDELAVGEGLILFSEPIADSVSQGDAVYYDLTNNRFARALAEVEEADSGLLRTGERAYVEGIAIRKLNNETADVLIRGRYRGTVINDAAGDPLPAGRYYLSGTDPGKLTSERPAVGVFVCTIVEGDDAGEFDLLVNPTPREVLEEHIHYRFELLVDPAGQAICLDGGLVSVEFAEDREGWLPADHEVFQSLAPAGAHFGYNWLRNATLAGLWPPQPLGSAYLELLGVGVSSDDVLVDSNGIWWLTNCNSKVPWETTECISSSLSLPVESSSSGMPSIAPCDPRVRRLILWFTKMVAKTDLSAVTGLKAIAPLEVTSCADPDGDGYCQGKVELNLDMDWQRDSGVSGSEVVKGVTGNNRLQVGHVAEGIRGEGLIEASGTQSLDSGYEAGLVTLTGLDPTSITRSLDVLLVALNGAEEDVYADIVPFIGLPSGRDSSFVGRVRIPTLSMADPRLRLNLWFAMPTAGTPPSGVSIEYAVVESAETTAESSSSLFGGGFNTLPTSWSEPVDLNLEDLGALSQGEYFDRLALTLEVGSNQLFLFRLRRSGTNGYAGLLGVINMVATLYEA